MPRFKPFNFDWRRFFALRFGFLMMNVPLPMYSALYRSVSFAKDNSLSPPV